MTKEYLVSLVGLVTTIGLFQSSNLMLWYLLGLFSVLYYYYLKLKVTESKYM